MRKDGKPMVADKDAKGTLTSLVAHPSPMQDAERSPRNPMAIFSKYDSTGELTSAAVPAALIQCITISKKTGETLLMMNPNGIIVLEDSFNKAVKVWNKFVHSVVFHQPGTSDGSLTIPIAIDAATIRRIEPSKKSGDDTAIIVTTTGFIKVTEKFMEAVEIAQN